MSSPDDWDFPPPRSPEPPCDSERVPDALPVTKPLRTDCWRCGHSVVLAAGLCPECGSPARGVLRERRGPIIIRHYGHSRAQRHHIPYGVRAVLWSYGLLLAVSIIQGIWILFGADVDGMAPEAQQRTLMNQVLFFEAIDTILVIVAVYWASRPPDMIQPIDGVAKAWVVAVPLLACLLLLNFGYHELLRSIIGQPKDMEFIELQFNSNPVLMVLAICIQPAIVEELFFRYLTLTHLRSIMSTHGAVWLSSLMFGVAHVHVPLSIPILTLVGVGIGYMRVWSGGMLLPILMHGIHNAVVLTIEAKG